MHLVMFKLFGDRLLNDGGLAVVRGEVNPAVAFWQEELNLRAAAADTSPPYVMLTNILPTTAAEVDRRRAAGEVIHEFAESATP